MIITPNIGIDNTHMNAFQTAFQTMNSLDDPGTTVRGTGDMKGLNITVKKIRTLQGNGIMLAVHNKNEGILVCRLVSAPVPQGAFPWGRRVYVMDQIRVHPDYIGQGLAPLVYRWLADNGYTVLSDSHQTPTSLAVWRKMATQGGVFTVNLKDGTWRPYDPTRVEDWVLFGNGDYSRYWPVRFVLPETKN